MTFRKIEYRYCTDCGRTLEDTVAERAHRNATGCGPAVFVTGWEHRIWVDFGGPEMAPYE
jgi:hypothetical protein